MRIIVINAMSTKRAFKIISGGFFSPVLRQIETILSFPTLACENAQRSFILTFNDLLEIKNVSTFRQPIAGEGIACRDRGAFTESPALRSARDLWRIWIDRRDRFRSGFQPLVLIGSPAAVRVRA